MQFFCEFTVKDNVPTNVPTIEVIITFSSLEIEFLCESHFVHRGILMLGQKMT